jgi:hypothetical protein
MAFGLPARLLGSVGIWGYYRRIFWRRAGPALEAVGLEPRIHTAIVSGHRIELTRDCLRGTGESATRRPPPRPSRPEPRLPERGAA